MIGALDGGRERANDMTMIMRSRRGVAWFHGVSRTFDDPYSGNQFVSL